MVAMTIYETIGQAYVIVATATFTGALIYCAIRGAAVLQRRISG